MTNRTFLLTVHIASVAGWLGADFLQYALTPRLGRESQEVITAWARQVEWLHAKYYPVVAVLVLASGVGLVVDGDWSWSSKFIWVGVGAVIGGATLGGGGLGSLSKRRVSELESGDSAAAAATHRRMIPIELVVTALPILAIVMMIKKWGAA